MYDRRKNTRIASAINGNFHNQEFSVNIEDISLSGIKIKTTEDLHPEITKRSSPYSNIKFKITDSEKELVITTITRWVNEKDDDTEIGLEFFNLTDIEKEQLENYIIPRTISQYGIRDRL